VGVKGHGKVGTYSVILSRVGCATGVINVSVWGEERTAKCSVSCVCPLLWLRGTGIVVCSDVEQNINGRNV